MEGICRFEFQLKHFGFKDCNAKRFNTFQWTDCRYLFFVYRFLTFAFQLGWLIAGCIAGSEIYFFKLSNWCMMYSTTYYTFAFICATHGLFAKKLEHIEPSDEALIKDIEKVEVDGSKKENCVTNQGNNLRWFHKITWVFQSVAIDTIFFITITYWTFIFPREDPQNRDIHGYVKHALNFGMLFIDVTLVNIPIRFLHFIYSVGSASVYSIFLISLHFAGLQSAIYEYTNFEKNPGIAAVGLFSFACVAPWVSHTFWLVIYHLRCCLSRCCKQKSAINS